MLKSDDKNALTADCDGGSEQFAAEQLPQCGTTTYPSSQWELHKH